MYTSQQRCSSALHVPWTKALRCIHVCGDRSLQTLWLQRHPRAPHPSFLGNAAHFFDMLLQDASRIPKIHLYDRPNYPIYNNWAQIRPVPSLRPKTVEDQPPQSVQVVLFSSYVRAVVRKTMEYSYIWSYILLKPIMYIYSTLAVLVSQIFTILPEELLVPVSWHGNTPQIADHVWYTISCFHGRVTPLGDPQYLL